MEIPGSGEDFLVRRIGPASALRDASLEEVLATVPRSRLPAHPLIDTSVEARVRHARGQSLPDWLAMRSGVMAPFPDGVAFPEHSGHVRELMDFCRQHQVVIIPYGGGTSVAGHVNPPALERPVLTVDLGRMNRLMALDQESLLATFGAGTPGPLVEAQLKEKGFTLGHFPQSFELSTLGGWVASRSSGQQSLRYGRIEQLFAGGRVETLQGTLELPTFPASAAGPDLREMILGSEGRLGILCEVKVRVSPLPERETFHVLFFPSWQQAREAARMLVQQRVQLSMLRLSNPAETETQLALAGHEFWIRFLERYLTQRGAGPGRCMMTFGLTGSKQQNQASLSQLKQIVKGYSGVGTGTLLGKKWAATRFRTPHLREALWRLGYVADTVETATDWKNLDRLMNEMERNLRSGLSDQGEVVHVFTHLSHFYRQGCSIYTTYVFRSGETYEETRAWWQRLKESVSSLIVNKGGTISHQHGVGKDHAPYLRTEKGELGIRILRALCRELDPQGLMNPQTLLQDE